MAEEKRGGFRPPDGRPRPPAGPGRFSQRTDLSEPPLPQGVYAPTGLPFGQRQQVERAQKVAPVPNRRVRPKAQGMTLADLLARPTARPDDPITAGLPVGPGPGPEILQAFGPQAISAKEALRLLEGAISGLPAVSVATLNLLTELRNEARGEFTDEGLA